MAIHIQNIRSRVLLGLIPSVLLVYSCGPSENIKSVGGPDEGKLTYQRYCISCHGSDGKLMVGNAADLSKSEIEDDAIRKVILYGNNKGMGPYRTIIKNDTTINALVKYVKTLRTN